MCFDEDNNGKISEDRLRELLTTMGDRYTDEQVNLVAYLELVNENCLGRRTFQRCADQKRTV